MGDSYISFDEGSQRKWGFNQRAVASNTIEELKTVISEPWLPTYGVSVTTAVSTNGGNKHLIQIMGSTLNRLYMRRLTVTQMVGAGSSTQGQFSLVRLTTAGTGGTSYTPRALDPVDGATTAAAMTLPSAQGTEDVTLWTGAGVILQTVPVVGLNPVIDLDWARQRTKGPVIAAGAANGLALKLITSIATATVHIYAEFSEAFWA